MLVLEKGRRAVNVPWQASTPGGVIAVPFEDLPDQLDLHVGQQIPRRLAGGG
jgi:hypothetical protein